MSTNRNIHDVIVERIHSSFAELIPEDEMRELVTSAIDKFKTPTTRTEYNRTVDVPSPLQSIVNEAVSNLVNKSVQDSIVEILNPTFDEHGKAITSAMLDQLVKDNMADIIQTFIGNMIKGSHYQIAELVKQDLRNLGLNI